MPEYQEIEARLAQQLIDAFGNERYEKWRAAGAALGLDELVVIIEDVG